MFVGIDVAKAWLDLAVVPTGERQRVVYDEPGVFREDRAMGVRLINTAPEIRDTVTVSAAAVVILLAWSPARDCLRKAEIAPMR